MNLFQNVRYYYDIFIALPLDIMSKANLFLLKIAFEN